jgi:citrate synthase
MTEAGQAEQSFLSAAQAAQLLGVKLATLYAYVSRGQVRSVAGVGRARRYLRADIEQLRARREGRRPDGAGSTLSWGEPVLDSAITEVRPEGPRYRGHDAVELAAQGVSFEAVAELLWTGALPAHTPSWTESAASPSDERALGLVRELVLEEASALAWLAVLVPALAQADPGRFDRTPAAVLPRARGLIGAMAQLLGAADSGGSLAERLLARSRQRPSKRMVSALDAGLILWADHELNVSSFAARVAASAHADVYSCLAAGLAALSGPRHGAACEQIYALLEEIRRPQNADAVLNERARRGEPVPGFGHPLYPAGDPRAIPLLEEAAQLGSRAPAVRTLLELVAVQRKRGHEPTIEVGFVALCEALKVGAWIVPGLIAIGRSAGWVAHILEQFEAGFLIRPRARYRPR